MRVSSAFRRSRLLGGSKIARSEERRVGKEWRSLCDWSSDVCSSDLFFLCEVDVGFKVAAHGGELFVRGNLFFGALALAQYSLSGLLVIPEMGVGDAGFQRLQTLAIAGRVKDSSVQACCAVSVIRSDLAGLRGSLVSFYLILVIA